MNNNPWRNYDHNINKIGKLCYMYCSKSSALPVRDILNEHKQGFKLEPNYETATYNWYSECNQRSVRAAVKDHLSHILFITNYAGQKREYQGRYFIVGYYEIGWTREVNKRIVVRAKRMCFVPIEKAYEVTEERWKCIAPNSKVIKLANLHWATQRIGDGLLDYIIKYLDEGDATNDFLYEVARLKSEYNPYDKIPNGRVFIINVGANTTSKLQSPVFNDKRFEFVPISEECEHLDKEKMLSYDNLKQFNFPDKPLLALFPQVSISSTDLVHNDPEFLTLTYGDNVNRKGNLKDLQSGDFIFFLARLVPYKDGKFQHENAFFALVGYLEIAEVLSAPDPLLFKSSAFEQNAHVIRWDVDKSSFENFNIFKGSANSRRFRYAVRFDREFAENIQLKTTNGNPWDWSRTTELGIIGSYTRTVRMYMDPNTKLGRQQAKMFWQCIWKVQKWNDLSKNKKESC